MSKKVKSFGFDDDFYDGGYCYKANKRQREKERKLKRDKKYAAFNKQKEDFEYD